MSASPVAAVCCNSCSRAHSCGQRHRRAACGRIPWIWAPRDLDKLIADPSQALDVFDFEPVMKQTFRRRHFGYMATGVDDETTLRANRAGFGKFELRPDDSSMSAESI